MATNGFTTEKETTMATIDPGKSPATRLQAGASILAAARTVDTHLIEARLAAFERAQNEYKSAHDEVGAAEARRLAAEAALSELGADQDHVVDALARALVADGLSRGNPFETYGPSPGEFLRMQEAAEVKAVRQLVAAIQRDEKRSKSALQVVQQLDKAARTVEQGLARIATLEAAVREARHKRDALGQAWVQALASLKRAARAAADDGAATLYATLFERPSKPKGRAAKAKPDAAPAPAAQPADKAAS
jgi:hypothetical protein